MGQSKPGRLGHPAAPRAETGDLAPSQPTGGSCPICKAASEQATRPFCSRRCADVDLSRWLRGAYAIPVPDDQPGDEDIAKPDPDRDG